MRVYTEIDHLIVGWFLGLFALIYGRISIIITTFFLIIIIIKTIRRNYEKKTDS